MLTVMQLWWSFCRTRSEEGIVQVHDAILERSATFCAFLAMQLRNNILCTVNTPCALASHR